MTWAQRHSLELLVAFALVLLAVYAAVGVSV
jgi:hypothetical protein